jgi:CRP/FNR family transcriptional regulator, cyclic AMP receptor protein
MSLDYASPSELTRLLQKQKVYKYSKGQVLLVSDDVPYLYYMHKGYVKRYAITNEGTISVQAINGPGQIFPLTPIYSKILKQPLYDGPEVHYYEAMSSIEVTKISPKDLEQILQKQPDLYQGILIETGKRLHANIQLLENISLKTSLKRVAHTLLYLSRQFGAPSKKGVKIKVPLTHQDIASILDTTRETVSVCMSELKKSKLITAGRRIVILNPKKLEELVYKLE